MGLVLWIDQNAFATGLLEKVFKKKNIPFYTLTDVSDFTYLVQDLKPALIVLDAKTALGQLEKFKTQYQMMKDVPFVLIDIQTELSFIEKVIGKIERPYDPFKIPGILEKFQKQN